MARFSQQKALAAGTMRQWLIAEVGLDERGRHFFIVTPYGRRVVDDWQSGNPHGSKSSDFNGDRTIND